MQDTTTLTKGSHYAFSVHGVGHGFCNARYWGQVGQALYFEIFNNQGVKIGPMQSVLIQQIAEIEERDPA